MPSTSKAQILRDEKLAASNKMPHADTLRRYYPDSALSDKKLMELAEFVRAHTGKNHISPDNEVLRVLVVWEEAKLKILST